MIVNTKTMNTKNTNNANVAEIKIGDNAIICGNTLTNGQLRIGDGMLTIGGITLQGKGFMLADAIFTILENVEEDEKGNYYIDPSEAVISLKMNYPENVRETCQEDINNSKPIKNALVDAILSKSEEGTLIKTVLEDLPDRMFANMNDALAFAIEDVADSDARYEYFVGTAGTELLGLMDIESILEVLKLYYDKAYPIMTK